MKIYTLIIETDGNMLVSTHGELVDAINHADKELEINLETAETGGREGAVWGITDEYGAKASIFVTDFVMKL
jgi:hypothetical protein